MALNAPRLNAGILPTNTIEEAVACAKYSGIVQLERVQAILDGAHLAVEQVQDKQLELLARKFQANASESWVSIVLGAVLSSSVVGALIAKATRSLLLPLARSTNAFRLMPVQRTRDNLASFAKQMRASANPFSLDDLKILKAGELEGHLMYVNHIRRYASALARNSSGAMGTTIEAGKTAWAVAKNDNAAPPPILAENTSGVGVLSAIQAYSSDQRLMIHYQVSMHEATIRMNLLADADLKAYLAHGLGWDTTPGDIPLLRSYYALLYETMIWLGVHGYHQENLVNLDSITGDKTLRGAERDLVSYWQRRFAPAIEKWSQGQGQFPRDGRIWRATSIADGAYLQMTESQRLLILRNYLNSFASAISPREVFKGR